MSDSQADDIVQEDGFMMVAQDTNPLPNAGSMNEAAAASAGGPDERAVQPSRTPSPTKAHFDGQSTKPAGLRVGKNRARRRIMNSLAASPPNASEPTAPASAEAAPTRVPTTPLPAPVVGGGEEDVARKLDVERLAEAFPRVKSGVEAVVAQLLALAVAVWLFIGETNAGKSTTAAWLAGHAMTEREVRDGDDEEFIGSHTVVDYMDSANRDRDDLPTLGHDNDACTSTFQAVPVADGRVALDAGGTADNRDRTFSVANTLAIFNILGELLDRNVPVCPLFFVNFKSFGRPSFLVEQLYLLQRLFPHPETIETSVLFLYTHVKPEEGQKQIYSELLRARRQESVKHDPNLVSFLTAMLRQLQQHGDAVIIRPTTDGPDALKAIIAHQPPLVSGTGLGVPLSELELNLVGKHVHEQGIVAHHALDSHDFRTAADRLGTIAALVEELPIQEFADSFASHRTHAVSLVRGKKDDALACLAKRDFAGLAGHAALLRKARFLNGVLRPALDVDVALRELASALAAVHRGYDAAIAECGPEFDVRKVDPLRHMMDMEKHVGDFFAHETTARDLLADLAQRHHKQRAGFKAALQILSQGLDELPVGGGEQHRPIADSLFKVLGGLRAARAFDEFPGLEDAKAVYDTANKQLAEHLLQPLDTSVTADTQALSKQELTAEGALNLERHFAVADAVTLHPAYKHHVPEDSAFDDLHGILRDLLNNAAEAAISKPLLTVAQGGPLSGAAISAVQQLAVVDTSEDIRSRIATAIELGCRILVVRLLHNQARLRELTEEVRSAPAEGVRFDHHFWQGLAAAIAAVDDAKALDPYLSTMSLDLAVAGCNASSSSTAGGSVEDAAGEEKKDGDGDDKAAADDAVPGDLPGAAAPPAALVAGEGLIDAMIIVVRQHGALLVADAVLRVEKGESASDPCIQLAAMGPVEGRVDIDPQPLLAAVDGFLASAAEFDGTKALAFDIAAMTYKCTVLRELLQRDLPAIKHFDGVATAGRLATLRALVNRITADGEAQANRLADEVHSLGAENKFNECSPHMDRLQELAETSGIHLQDVASVLYQRCTEKLQVFVTEAEATVNRLVANDSFSEAHPIRDSLQAAATLQSHVPLVGGIVDRLNANITEVLSKAGAEIKSQLNDGSYEDVVQTMTALQRSEGSEEQATFRHLQQVIRSRLSKDVRTNRTVLKKLVSSTDLKTPGELASEEKNPLGQLEACSDFVDQIRSLAPVANIGVEALESELLAVVRRVFDILMTRLDRSLQWMTYKQTEQLQRALSQCNVWHHVEDEKRERLSKVLEDIDKISERLMQQVTEALEAREGRAVMEITEAVQRAADQEAFATRHNFRGLADRIAGVVRAALEERISVATQQLNTSLEAAKKTITHINAIARPLEEKGLPPFSGGAAGAEQHGIGADVRELRQQYNKQQRTCSLPRITKAGVEALVDTMCQGTDAGALDAGALDKLVAATVESVGIALDKIPKAELDDCADVSFEAAAAIYQAVEHLEHLLNQHLEIRSVKHLHDSLRLDEKIPKSLNQLGRLLKDIIANTRSNLKNNNTTDAEQQARDLQRILAADCCPRALVDKHGVAVARLVEHVEGLTRSLAFGQPEDRMSLLAPDSRVDGDGEAAGGTGGTSTPAFDPGAIGKRCSTLQQAAKHYARAEEADGMLDVGDGEAPDVAFERVRAYWGQQFEAAEASMVQGIDDLDAKPLAVALPRVESLRAISRLPAELSQQLEKCRNAVMESLETLRKGLNVRVGKALKIDAPQWDDVHRLVKFVRAVDDEVGMLVNLALSSAVSKLVSKRIVDLDSSFTRNSDVATYATHLARLQAFRAGCNLKDIAGQVQERIKGHVEAAKFDVLEFAQALSEQGLHGEQVKQQFPKFEAARIKERQNATRGMSLDATIAELRAAPAGRGVTEREAAKIRDLYTRYCAHFAALVAQPPSQWKAMVADAKKVARKKEQDETSLLRILALVTAVWSQLSRVRLRDETCRAGVYMEPHVIQVIGLLALLGLVGRGDDGDSSSLAQRAWGWFKAKTGSGPKAKLSEGVFVECLTGNGKSILLGLTSTVFALLGWDVSCACYSSHLSSRDYDAFERLFAAFGVTGRITYSTIDELAKQFVNRRGHLGDAALRFLRHGKAGAAAAGSGRGRNKEVLLVDEADLLFDSAFLDRPYHPAVLIRHPAVVELFKIITATASRPTVEELQKTDAYKQLLAEYSHGQELIDVQLAAAVAAQGTHGDHEHRVVDNEIAYKRLDQWTSKWIYGYETAMAYLHEAAAGTIPMEDAEQHLYLQVPVGGFSFARIVEQFDLILGVTGTLNLSKLQTETMRKRFRVTQRFFLPSLYGPSQLKVDDVVLTETKDRHHLALAEEAHAQVVGAKRAVLMFFADEPALRAFEGSAEFVAKFGRNSPNVMVATESIRKDDLVYTVQRATQQGRLLLAVRVFGRGQDFVVLDPRLRQQGGVHVIQTFLSLEASEEVQVRGRTARDKNSGSYQLVLCYADVEQLFAAYERSVHPAVPKAARLATIPSELDAGRREINDELVKLLLAKMDPASADSKLHDRTEALRDRLLGGSGDTATTIGMLLSFCPRGQGPSRNTDAVFVLDISGSMSPYMEQGKQYVRKGALEGLGLVDGLHNNTAGIITFHSVATTMSGNGSSDVFSADKAVVERRVDAISGSGGTQFLPPLQQAEAELRTLKARNRRAFTARQRVVLFQTDGANGDAASPHIAATAKRIIDDLDTTIVAILVGPGALREGVMNLVGRAGAYDGVDRSDMHGPSFDGLILSIEDYDALESEAANIAAHASAL